MDNLNAQVAILNSKLSQLGTSDQKFAVSLMDAYKKYGGLSVKQAPWIAKLIARADAIQSPKATPVNVGGFAGVVALFTKAQEHKLKFPKISLKVNDQVVVLSLNGAKSKSPGSINITGIGKYPHKTWYGRVSPDGMFTPSPSLEFMPAMRDALKDTLTKLSHNPARVAKDYGKLTGNCCFCGKALGYGEDQRSVVAGFGPVCAKHYGLMDEWNAAVVKQGLQPVLGVSTLKGEHHPMMNTTLLQSEVNVAKLAEKIAATWTPAAVAPLAEMANKIHAELAVTVVPPEEEDETHVKLTPWKTGMINAGLDDVEDVPKYANVVPKLEEPMFKVIASSPEPVAVIYKCYFCEKDVEKVVIKEGGFMVCEPCDKEMEEFDGGTESVGDSSTHESGD